ncbi:hypothetical protein [Deinococcus aquaedulcis]|uniref:hypothetical protein n=1 Tax=Deinococcus aquaedulcis TaxID=2840455 RepID=UPI001C82DA67|nr:hypothetical protein [Deinococcus aquaedulcis]
MNTTLDLRLEHLGTTLDQVCAVLAQQPTAAELASRLGPAVNDPLNRGEWLLIESPPPQYESVRVSIPRSKADPIQFSLRFRPEQGPSALALAQVLGPWEELPVETHLPEFDQRHLSKTVRGYVCAIIASVERPAEGETSGDHVRELTIYADRF